MIRLVTAAPEEPPWRAIQARLRRTAIEWSGLERCRDRLEACQASVFLGFLALDQSLVEQLLREGKHVLIAGATCWPGDVLEYLSTIARQAGVFFSVVNPDRYLPSRQLIKQQIPGKVGAPGLLRLIRWEPANHFGLNLGLPAPLVLDVDMALWLMDKKPNLVYAAQQPGHFQIHLGFSAGMALIDFDHALPAGDGYQSLYLVGSSGAAHSDDHQNMQFLYRGGQPCGVRTGEGIVHLASLVQDFADAIASGRDLSQGSDWRTVLAGVDAINRSLSEHRAVSLEGP